MDITTTVSSGVDGLSWKEQMLHGGASKKEQAEHLAREFEGILMRQYLDRALAPMDPEAGFFGAKGSPMYDQLIKDALTSSFTKGGSLGFSSVLQAQLFPESQLTEKGPISDE